MLADSYVAGAAGEAGSAVELATARKEDKIICIWTEMSIRRVSSSRAMSPVV